MKPKQRILAFIFLTCFFLPGLKVQACQCPPTSLSIQECDKYEIIFRGKIISVKNCDHRFGEAMFELDELFKGNATKTFKVLFDCNEECAQTLLPGEEWIIYSRYKQIDNAKLDWCSRSRKHFDNERQDFYAVNYGNDYLDELRFLRDNLGAHRFLKDKKEVLSNEQGDETGNRNKLPANNEFVIMLLISLGAIVLFYWLFNRFFR